MKVAFTSSTGERIDQHFGQCQSFHVWEIGPDAAQHLTTVSALTTADAEEDHITARANAISGCSIVYTLQIGGPAAAKLIARKIHPMKTTTDMPVIEAVEKLQQVLRGNPPPWLRKAMNHVTSVSFIDEEQG